MFSASRPACAGLPGRHQREPRSCPFISGKSVTLWDEGQRLKQYDFFVQDEWKSTPNLVINYGLRWEINPAPTEAGGRVYVPNKPIDGSQGPVTFVHADRWFKNNNLGALGRDSGLRGRPGSARTR